MDDAIYPAGLMLWTDRAATWSPPSLDRLAEHDLASLLSPLPEFILLGTGTTLVRPAPALAAALEARGCGLEPLDSRAAARLWGVLRTEGRTIAAALYPL